ncbi:MULTISPECIES: energy transducer TonB family protein [Marinobacter]|uniref:TonB family protein n=1 Tax=Marinobacter xiaoshiensis TaxID=3073652 RepID=A0ABU2HL72_9GAMM|nr:MULTISPECIES: energy transducer TonB [unclassified Marinobacter]MBK1872850.1 TonB family protein [Marinobacter sp. 1-3A]MBK1886925.1 TonB family protein [Marinobacter sp. DY40_1A1]MDS1311823.1 TonB family protein [Marinobacter sp. F60267]
MLEHGSNNSLPAKHRIALALSTAFLIHTLLLSGFPAILPDLPIRHRHQLNLELVAVDSSQGIPASANPQRPNDTPEPRNPPFEVPPQNTPGLTTPEVTTTNSQQKISVGSKVQATTPNNKADATQTTATPSTSGAQSNSGVRTQVADKQTTEDVTKITLSPSEQDPYLIKLATHLATKLETLRIPAIRQLTDTSTMELELQLLSNGALTRARVVKSTGIQQIDLAAYQAALSASPYPEPPPDQKSKSRFEVKLVFSPSRL